MRIGNAVEAMQAGSRVARECWGDDHTHPMFNCFLVLVAGREITVDREPMVQHVASGTKMQVNPHFDLVDADHGSLTVNYQFTAEDMLADDWAVIDWTYDWGMERVSAAEEV